MRLYDHPASANCMKCRVLLRLLELPFDTVTVDLFRRETRSPEHLARNPDGRVPVLELDGGETIPESGAIMLYLAEGTPLLPGDRLARARVHQWLFFEQNQIEAQLAVTRFLVLTGRAGARTRARRLAGRARARLDGHARARAGRRPRVPHGRRASRSPTSRCTPTCTARATRGSTRASSTAWARGSTASRPCRASSTTSRRSPRTRWRGPS